MFSLPGCLAYHQRSSLARNVQRFTLYTISIRLADSGACPQSHVVIIGLTLGDQQLPNDF